MPATPYRAGTAKPVAVAVRSGGAILGGVFVRSDRFVVAARRTASGSIDVAVAVRHPDRFARVPLLRGVATFFESFAPEIAPTSWSADCVEAEQATPHLLAPTDPVRVVELPRARPRRLARLRGFLGLSLYAVAAPHLVALAIWRVAGISASVLSPQFQAFAALAGVVLLVGFWRVLARTPEIRRLYGDNAAFMAALAASEDGLALDLQTLRRHSAFHPRSSAISVLFVLVLLAPAGAAASLLVAPTDGWLVQSLALYAVKTAALPLAAGIAEEATRALAALYRVRVLRAPIRALAFVYRVSVAPPDDGQLAVAIAAFAELTIREA